ncbi:hypothetical protein Q7P37_008836 [Cladosporium fusiforme]
MPTPCRLSLGQCSYRPPSPPAAIPPSPRDGNFVPLRHYKGSDHGGTNGHSEENNQESRVPMPICDSNTQNQKRKKYNCEQCQKAFDHTPDLRHHMRFARESWPSLYEPSELTLERMHEPQRRERTLVRHGFDKHPAHAAKIHVHRTVIVVTVMICIHIMRNYGECHRRALRGNTRWKAFELQVQQFDIIFSIESFVDLPQMILRHEPSWLVCPDPLLLLAACMAFVGLMQLWYELHNQDDLQTWIMSASFITGLAIGGFLGHSLIFTALTVLPSALCLGLLLSHALHRLWGWRSHGKRGTVYPNLVEDVMDDDSAWSKAEKKDLSDDEIDKASCSKIFDVSS